MTHGEWTVAELILQHNLDGFNSSKALKLSIGEDRESIKRVALPDHNVVCGVFGGFIRFVI